MFNETSAVAFQYWLLLFLSLGIGWLFRNKYGHGLNKYPGPLIASWTNWWRFYDVSRGQHHKTLIELHKKHGDVVRLGPNVVSFADPRAIKEIYGLKRGFKKSGFYPVWSPMAKGSRVFSLFSLTDEGYHAQFRRCINGAFSMSTMVSYEPLVDSTTTAFIDQTQKLFVDTGATCDFARWLQMYAFDNIGEMTWSKRLGFIDKFEDVDGIMENLVKYIRYASIVGQQPWIDSLVGKKNALASTLSRWGLWDNTSPVAVFAAKRSAERHAKLKDPEKAADHKDVDFLARFMAAQKDHPDFMTDYKVFTATVSLPTAGSDTTASSLSAVFYYLLRNPSCYAKLMHELTAAIDTGKVTLIGERALISWTDAQKLPYLEACIQEAFRLFPAVGLLLERHVPVQGATICGEQIPGGVIVGCNAWVVQRRKEVFGEDSEAFRPERWLEAEPTRLKEMKASMLHFGAGTRTCIGKNISLLEMYKLVPTFLWNFEVEFVDPEIDWAVENSWFVRQSEFNVRFRKRVVESRD